MNWQNARARSSGGGVMFGGAPTQATATPTVSGNFNTNFGVNGSASGPAIILIGLTLALVAHYVWTKGVQGGR